MPMEYAQCAVSVQMLSQWRRDLVGEEGAGPNLLLVSFICFSCRLFSPRVRVFSWTWSARRARIWAASGSASWRGLSDTAKRRRFISCSCRRRAPFHDTPIPRIAAAVSRPSDSRLIAAVRQPPYRGAVLHGGGGGACSSTAERSLESACPHRRRRATHESVRAGRRGRRACPRATFQEAADGPDGRAAGRPASRGPEGRASGCGCVGRKGRVGAGRGCWRVRGVCGGGTFWRVSAVRRAPRISCSWRCRSSSRSSCPPPPQPPRAAPPSPPQGVALTLAAVSPTRHASDAP